MIRLEAVSAAVPASAGGSAPRVLIHSLDAVVVPGESRLVLGANGSGKTTLVRLLAGLARPAAGRVLLDGEEIGSDGSPPLWPRVAVLFEEPDPQFLAETVEEEVTFGLESLGLSVPEIRARAAEAIESFGLSGMGRRDPHSLSAGEKARTLLAAVMAANPRFLLLDQTLAHLDPGSRRDLESRLVRDAVAGGRAIWRTHQDADPPLAGETLWVLDGGVLRDAARYSAEEISAAGAVPLPLALRVSAALAARGRWKGALAMRTAELAAGIGAMGPLEAPPPPGAPPAPLRGGTLPPPAAPVRSRGSGAPILSLSGVSWAPRGDGSRRVLDAVNLDVHHGEIVALVGRSGSGKTTLLKLAAGLIEASAGDVRRGGTKGRKLAALALEYPERQLFGRTVAEDVGAVLWVAGVPAEVRRARARSAMEAIGLDPARFEDRAPFTLSEGEKRRAAIAGLLADPPAAVLLDEPTAGLDPQGRRALRQALDLLRGRGHAVVFASHDLDFVGAAADRVLVLGREEGAAGTVLGEGPPRAVWSDRELLGRAGLPAPDYLEVEALLRGAGLVEDEARDAESLVAAVERGRVGCAAR